ncbi:MAG: alpha/beta fold hydrolase [Alphaproteobacteria bacterium]
MSVPTPSPHAREGPRPLPLHLARAASLWSSSLAALPLARNGSLPWSPVLTRAAAALAAPLAAADPEALAAALAGEAARRLEEMLAGIEAYRRHPYRRRLRDPPVLWREGTTRLLDYGARRKERDKALPALFVPSLVNRGYILDLSRRHSLMRDLAGRGVRPLLVDWGAPGEAERTFGLDDYIAGRLEAALDAAVAACGGPMAVVGYCMGGLLALALALRRPREVRGLALLATPWDFHADNAAIGRLLAAAQAPLDAMLTALSAFPVDLLQTMFTWSEPTLVADKFRAFARLDPESRHAEDFVALEDWLNDGVPLAGPVARECLVGWYGDNEPARGAWRVAGAPVRPEDLALPALVVVPGRDRIVPPASAAALADAIPGAERLVPPAGHIGMVVGGAARAGLWRPLGDWLRALH